MRTLTVVAATALVAAVAPATALSASCTPGWNVAKTVPVGSSLYKVSALSGNAWAIGERVGADGSGVKDPLMMRFDGSRWTEVPLPGADELTAVVRSSELDNIRDVRLEGVFARTATDAWAVGHARATTESVETAQLVVAMRWDGAASRERPPLASIRR